MTGYTKTHRAVFEHELFSGDEFSRREAWLWMISNAAWKPRRFRHKKQMLPIGRGQLPGGRRHLAEAWGWGEQRVRTFLCELENEGMIELLSNQQLTIISICKYSEYQAIEEISNQQLTSIQPAANHTKEGKELKEEEKKEVVDPISDQKSLDALKAYELYNETALQCGLAQAAKFTPGRRQKIQARLKDYGLDGWKQALANIERSSFLTGANDRNWKASLDFLVKPASFDKVHDGGYGNGRHNPDDGPKWTFANMPKDGSYPKGHPKAARF